MPPDAIGVHNTCEAAPNVSYLDHHSSQRLAAWAVVAAAEAGQVVTQFDSVHLQDSTMNLFAKL